MTVFRLFHTHGWSEASKSPTDPVIKTDGARCRYERILRRMEFIEDYAEQHKEYPTNYGEDNFTSDEEPLHVEMGTIPKYRPPVPGDFVLTFNVLVLANSLESELSRYYLAGRSRTGAMYWPISIPKTNRC